MTIIETTRIATPLAVLPSLGVDVGLTGGYSGGDEGGEYTDGRGRPVLQLRPHDGGAEWLRALSKRARAALLSVIYDAVTACGPPVELLIDDEDGVIMVSCKRKHVDEAVRRLVAIDRGVTE